MRLLPNSGAFLVGQSSLKPLHLENWKRTNYVCLHRRGNNSMSVDQLFTKMTKIANCSEAVFFKSREFGRSGTNAK